jgi:phage terminase small subunit
MAGVKGKSGGKRAGAGRKPLMLSDSADPRIPSFTAIKKPADAAKVELPHVTDIAEHRFKNGLDFLIFVMNDTTCSAALRLDAAKALAPYQHVKKGEIGKKEQLGEAAAKAGTGKYAPSAPQRTGSVLPFRPLPEAD